jgi:MFS transporter, ACS family, D-galactonate transporter
MTALIFLFMFINFADKAVLGLAAQPLMAELKLSPEQFGLIGSAFFLLFPVSAVLVGFVTNRVAARHTLLAMAILWSLVQFPMLGVTTVIAPLVMGAVVQNAATPTAGHERGYLIRGGLLLAGGLIGLLFIRPEQDRQELARHALPAASLQPAGG